ncbi:MAG: hypothetical protein LBL80_05510 [Ruminococcus sp.]|jgi:Tfp pilus assembly protein PilO|nr:hypothetical protein [Ruminococcus sp.]
MMKLSYRDKIIAIVITVIVILAVGIIFIVMPEIDKYQAKQLDVQNKETEQQTVQAKIDTLPVIQTDIIRSLGEIGNLQDPFYLEEYHYQLEQLFHSYADEAELDINSISFSIDTEEIKAYQYQPAYNILAYTMKMNADLYGTLPEEVMNIYNEVELAEKPMVDIGVMNINVVFGEVVTWEDMEPFINVISDLDRTILINTLAPVDDRDEEGNGGSTSVSLRLYTIVPMDIDTVIENEQAIAEENGTLEALASVISEVQSERASGGEDVKDIAE